MRTSTTIHSQPKSHTQVQFHIPNIHNKKTVCNWTLNHSGKTKLSDTNHTDATVLTSSDESDAASSTSEQQQKQLSKEEDTIMYPPSTEVVLVKNVFGFR